MSTDFATLLSHCTTRIDSHVDSAKDCQYLPQECRSESNEQSNETASPVRSGIKNIIEDKIKKRRTEMNVNIVETMQMHGGVGEDVENIGNISNKPKILFSLKDFLDRSDEPNVSEGKHLENEDDDHTNKFSHGSESDEINDWSGDDSDVISDSDSSDLELADEIEVDESIIGIESKSNKTPQIEDSFNFSQHSFESELGVMDELKRKLDDNIVNALRTENNIDRYCKNKTPMGGSNLDPINIDDDGDDNDNIGNDHEVNSMEKSKLDLKGLSISVVGGDGSSNNIEIETLLTKRLNTSQRSQPKPNLSQKNVPVISHYVPGKEVLKKSSLTFCSGDDIPGDQIAPIITLDENIQVEDISSDEEIFEHVDDVYKFDNCAHGDLADYICASCAYSRWRCERGFVNNLQVHPEDRTKSRGLTIERVNPVATEQPPQLEYNMLRSSDSVVTEKKGRPKS